MKLCQFFVLGVLVVGVPLLSSGQNTTPLSEAEMSAGQKSFLQYCSACHGPEGRGNGPVAAALRTPPADLTRIAARRGGQFPEAEVASYIDGRIAVGAHGSREMPVWGERLNKKFGSDAVSEEMVQGHLLILVNYLKSLQQ